MCLAVLSPQNIFFTSSSIPYFIWHAFHDHDDCWDNCVNINENLVFTNTFPAIALPRLLCDRQLAADLLTCLYSCLLSSTWGTGSGWSACRFQKPVIFLGFIHISTRCKSVIDLVNFRNQVFTVVMGWPFYCSEAMFLAFIWVVHTPQVIRN